MQAGKLTRQIVIEQPATAQDALGQQLTTWTRVLGCWAQIAALTGKEVYAAGGGFSGQLSHKVTIRYMRTPISAGMRVRYGARLFLIQMPPANPNEANEELDLMCLEQTP